MFEPKNFFEWFLDATNKIPTGDNRYWEYTKKGKVPHLAGISEQFCEVNSQNDFDIITAFQSATPTPDQFLLHLAAGWDSNRHKVPVILVHGAALTANSWANFSNTGYKGLQAQLVSLGYRVFGLTFSHPHGDNFYQAEQLAQGIRWIREITKSEQVDIVAHSKGGIAARIYLSNMASQEYQGEVRKLVMLGVPNLGTDFAFRCTNLTYMMFLSSLNIVIPWDKINSLGTLVDMTRRSIYAEGTFTGQAQMLYDWDDIRKLDVTQQDWWTTYYGGTGLIGRSFGLKKAMDQGENLIRKLEANGLQPGIEIHLLAGEMHDIVGEHGGPRFMGPAHGDGIVFIDSALHSDGLTLKGSKIKAKDIMPYNHVELLYQPQVGAWVDQQLTMDK